MNNITVKDAHAVSVNGYHVFSLAPKGTDKSKSLTFYPYAENGKCYVAYFIDESGEGEPIENRFEGSLANAVLAYNGYDVGGE